MIRQPIAFPGGKPLTRAGAAQVVQTASRFSAHIMIEHDQKIVNAKSMLGLLSLGLVDQAALQMVVEGPDEADAAEAMRQLLTPSAP